MASNLPPEPEKAPPESEEKKEKGAFTETIDSLKKNENVESLSRYVQANKFDTVAYVLLVIGLIWAYVGGLGGWLILGLVFGYYYSEQLVDYVKGASGIIDRQGVAKSIVLGALFLALLLDIPGLFIGAAIAVGVSLLLKKQK